MRMAGVVVGERQVQLCNIGASQGITSRTPGSPQG